MESRINTSAIITNLQIGATLTINAVSETVNILTFGSDFARVILDNPSSFYASIFRPDLTSGDTAEAIVNATGNPPRIIQYNQTGIPVGGLAAYSIAVQPWTNGYSAAIGDVVIFEPATNPIANQNYLVGTCAMLSSTLIQGETCFRGALRDIYRLKRRVDSLTSTDLSALLSDDFSITRGVVLCSAGSLALSSSAGTARYKGQNFAVGAGSFTGLSGKTLYRHIAKTDGTFESQAENSSGGVIDAIYNPSGSSPLPTAASPVWTASGTASTETVANSVLTLAVSTNNRTYSRASVAGPPASGSTLDAIVQWISGIDVNRIEIDDGTNREEVIINETQVKLVSSGAVFSLDCRRWVHLRLTLQSGISRLYVNGQLVLSSTSALASISNRFRFGCHAGYSSGSPTNGTGSFNIAYIENIGSASVIPAFPSLSGALIGDSVTSASGQTETVSIQSTAKNVELGNRREGRLIGVSDLNSLNTSISNLKTTRAIIATDNILTTDRFILLNGSGITANIFSAIGNAGAMLTFVNIHATGIATLDPSGSETMRLQGQTYTTLQVQPGQVVTLVSDGANWQVIKEPLQGPRGSRLTMSGAVTQSSNLCTFPTIDENFGDAITYAAGPPNTFTINQSGVYAMKFSATALSSSLSVGILKNSTSFSSGVHLLATQFSGASNAYADCSFVGWLAAGDIIRFALTTNATFGLANIVKLF